MAIKEFLLVVTMVAWAFGQRPPFAGSRPIGYPEVTTSTVASAAAASGDLGNRFGDDTPTTTQRLPLEANGDKDLVDRLSKLPVDQQPFWFINWQALEANRKNPQTYPVRPSQFSQPLNPTAAPTNTGSVQNNVNSGNTNNDGNNKVELKDPKADENTTTVGNRNGVDTNQRPNVGSLDDFFNYTDEQRQKDIATVNEGIDKLHDLQNLLAAELKALKEKKKNNNATTPTSMTSSNKYN